MEAAAPRRSAEMPRYRCHKIVWALKIAEIRQAPADQERVNSSGDWYLVPEDRNYPPMLVSHDYIVKHRPMADGYFVVYQDGYQSFSPADVFEGGYTRIGGARTAIMSVDDIARVCHEANRWYCAAVGDPGLPEWDNLEESYRESSRTGVRSALAGATPEGLHESWSKERLAAGWQYGPVLDRVAKIHPCLVPYADLPPHQQRKDALFQAIVKALSAG